MVGLEWNCKISRAGQLQEDGFPLKLTTWVSVVECLSLSPHAPEFQDLNTRIKQPDRHTRCTGFLTTSSSSPTVASSKSRIVYLV